MQCHARQTPTALRLAAECLAKRVPEPDGPTAGERVASARLGVGLVLIGFGLHSANSALERNAAENFKAFYAMRSAMLAGGFHRDRLVLARLSSAVKV